MRCTECGALCGVHDARERTWRHPGIWQYRTVVHCRVPRADCPEHGVRTVGAPWEVRPNSHLAALFEAQVLVAALSGSTVRAISSRTGEPEGRVWAMLSRAVSEARAGADYGDVTRVAVDDTARARGQGYISVMADLDGRRVVAVTEGRDRGAPSRLRGRLEAGGGDRSAVAEVTRDMAEANSRGCAEAMPNAHQTVDRFHVMQPFSKATDRVRAAEAKSGAEKRALPRGTKYVRPKRRENLTDRQAATRGPLSREHPPTARACATAGAMRAACACPDREEAASELDRLLSWMTHPDVGEMKRVARTVRKEREGVLNWWSARASNGFLEGMNPVVQSVKRASRGFGNIGNFATMIFLGLGRLDFSTQAASLCASH